MHPRNIYNKRLDFKKLCQEFPEFNRVTTLDLKGQISLDFKDPEALKVLSRTLLKRDFNLEVDFPPDTLVPTVPLRLNYILFIEDLLSTINKSTNIKGIDIGTGASCVYPLIAARKDGWKMVATDIDPNSIEYARKNVSENKLEHLIEVVQVDRETILKEVLERDTTNYDFCMCNPPFFSDAKELCSQQRRKLGCSSPNNAYSAKMHEVLTDGGEVQFVKKLIEESAQFQSRIKIYTSMLGLKRNIKPLLVRLREMSYIKSVITTEFHQGNTTRFGIAWTFDESIDLTKVSKNMEKKNNKNKPFIYCKKPFSATSEEVDRRLKEIFNELEIKYTVTKNTKNMALLYNITADKNTWSHSRRKRREVARGLSDSSDQITTSMCEETSKADTHGNEASLLKRKCDDTTDTEDLPDSKKLKTNEQQDCILKSTIMVHVESELLIELNFVKGLGGRDAAHQVLQYIKNNLQLE